MASLSFEALPLAGVFRVVSRRVADERGWFQRGFCAEEFAAAGLPARIAQSNLSWNRWRGTLRGLHYQAAPHAEAKLVSCLRGAIHDVAVDLREGSPTRGRWHAERLAADDGRALWLPEGFAHGFLTLADDTLVAYQMSAPYVAEAARGLRWDDPALGIAWPEHPLVVSERDRSYPPFA